MQGNQLVGNSAGSASILNDQLLKNMRHGAALVVVVVSSKAVYEPGQRLCCFVTQLHDPVSVIAADAYRLDGIASHCNGGLQYSPADQLSMMWRQIRAHLRFREDVVDVQPFAIVDIVFAGPFY